MKLFNEHDIVWEAYDAGFASCENGDTGGNPYPSGTDAWYSWNRGWNACLLFEEKKENNERIHLP